MRIYSCTGKGSREKIKKQIGAVYEHDEAMTIEVKGRCLIQGLPKNITLTSKEMLEAMMEPISAILDAICTVIENTPPELMGDILKHGTFPQASMILVSTFHKAVSHRR